jgi:hypothetical protein
MLKPVLNDWIYVTDASNENRFALGLKGKHSIACLGVNPSKAHPEKWDSTIQSVDRIARFNGYDSWVMFNLIPFRATNPKNIPLLQDNSLLEKNEELLFDHLKKYNIRDIWLCYGNLVETRDFLMYWLKRILSGLLEEGYCLKTADHLTKLGHPRHPLYMKSTTLLRAINSSHLRTFK